MIVLDERTQNVDPFADRSLYTIKDVPLKEVRSVRRHTPSLGWQYIIIVISSGKMTSLVLFSVVGSVLMDRLALLCHYHCLLRIQ